MTFMYPELQKFRIVTHLHDISILGVKVNKEKKKLENNFQLSSIMEESAKESQDLLDENVSE